MSLYVRILVLVLTVAACQAFLRRFCGLTNEDNRQNVMNCMKTTLSEEIKNVLEQKLREIGVNDIDAVNRICEEYNKDSNYKIPFEEGQKPEDVRNVQGVMASCIADEISKASTSSTTSAAP